jgi:hypothetical protein
MMRLAFRHTLLALLATCINSAQAAPTPQIHIMIGPGVQVIGFGKGNSSAVGPAMFSPPIESDWVRSTFEPYFPLQPKLADGRGLVYFVRSLAKAY